MSPAPAPQAAIVIVNYRSHHLLEKLAQGALAGIDATVLVVDNFSDATEQTSVQALADHYGWDALLLETNTGFGGGLNAGITRALDGGATTLLALNPDIEAEPDVLAALHQAALERPDAIISPLMLRADGTPYFRGSQLDLHTGATRGGWVGRDREPSAHWVGWLTGACLAFHRDVVERVGLLDESFFLYWEDVEWTVRAAEIGVDLVLRDDLVVVHDEGGTQRAVGDVRTDDAKSARYYYFNCRNRLVFGARRLSRPALLRWLAHTPSRSWEILCRGGRRHLLANPTHLLAGMFGTLAGLAAIASISTERRATRRPALARQLRTVRPAGSARATGAADAVADGGPAVPAVLLTHPGAELYGSDRMFLEAVLGFVDAGWRTVVALPDDGPLADLLITAGAEVRTVPTVVVRKSLLHPSRLASTAAALVTGLVSHRRLLHEIQPDLVYVNTVTLPVWLAAARSVGTPSLCHVHEAESGAPALLRRLLYAPTLLADTLVMNSEFSLDVCARSSWRTRERSVVVYNGVPGPATAPAPVRAEIDEVRLLFVGRLSPRKGPQIAVEALALLRGQGRPARLELLGSVFPGYEWFEGELVEQVERLGLTEHVTFAGFHPEIWTRFAASDVVLVPSTVDEPFGNTAVEALLAGRPLVVSANGGLVEATAGFGAVTQVRPGEAAEVAGAVVGLLERWPEVVEQAEVDARDAADRYSPARFQEILVATASQLVSR